jgi:hypothetical protein
MLKSPPIARFYEFSLRAIILNLLVRIVQPQQAVDKVETAKSAR